MPEHVKIQLTAGSREIIVEGPRKDVDELLTKWWLTPHEQRDETDLSDDREKSAKSSGKARYRRAASPSAAKKNGIEKFDPQPVVNGMREHEQFGAWEIKVLHADILINKIKLVSWYHKEPMTTGEIASVLDGLGVKTDVPTVSKRIKKSLSEFLQDGARSKGAIVRYKLTGKAEKDFDVWLSSNE